MPIEINIMKQDRKMEKRNLVHSLVCAQPALRTFALLMLTALVSMFCGCQSRWATPHPKGVKGQYNFLDTFDGKRLEAGKWEYTIQQFWPPGTSNRLDNLSSLVPQPYDFTLDGNTYVELIDGKLVQYVNCSNWYDTIRTWPIWEVPTEGDSKVYFFIWGAVITRVPGSILDHPKDTGHIGFLIALCEEYEQSYFHDRRFYYAIKGLLPRSIGAKAIDGTTPRDLKDVRITTEMHWEYPSQHSFADEYVEVGEPVDLSWVLFKDAIIARWKRSSETEWRQLQHVKASTKYVRLRFAGSWSEYTVDAVQVSEADITEPDR
jgi:hypothetical protein